MFNVIIKKEVHHERDDWMHVETYNPLKTSTVNTTTAGIVSGLSEASQATACLNASFIIGRNKRSPKTAAWEYIFQI
ncbi:unnamed protein product [Phytophthora lilii]|uniref:Unnamed protein product n=1 Tax=Phytophthora lilii TaxID=2077276 RepID=A0A9W6TPW7_9STRA|nr:unnamed protein product [Phytophthora lilii]